MASSCSSKPPTYFHHGSILRMRTIGSVDNLAVRSTEWTLIDIQVWLHEGNLLIIPLQPTDTALKAAPLSPSVTPEESRRFLAEHANKLLHSPTIESEAFYRIRNFPAQINDSMHHALTTVPRTVAYLLHHNAAYISPATEAFYLRDPIALKPLQAENAEELVFTPEDFVTVSIKFTKVGYAQLRSQRFSAPSVWDGNLPSDQGSKDYARAEMGMKVTCGMEMLVRDPQSQDKASVREIKLLLEDLRSGEDLLPEHDEIMKWSMKDDDDKWLDIDFEDFERELGGKAGRGSETVNGHFGETSTQENLRKMVQRFEDFLKDDTAGADGAEIPNSMDFDDDEDSESDLSSEGEDKAVSFDENEFARMMREMMGMPADEQDGSLPAATLNQHVSRFKATESDDEDGNEGEEIRNVMQRMEAELNEAGALDLDPTPKKIAAMRTGFKVKEAEEGVASSTGNEEEKHDQEVDINFDLVKNLLDSYKSQAGMAGPGGNLLGMMGIQLPADADDTLP